MRANLFASISRPCWLAWLGLWKLASNAGLSTGAAAYGSADELLADVDSMRSALAEAGAGAVAQSFLLPLRREVGVFRFNTARLDIRENSPRVNQALVAIFRCANPGAEVPALDSPGWQQWLLSELRTPREHARPLDELPPESAETLRSFRVIAQLRHQLDREAFGALILSMTHSAS